MSTLPAADWVFHRSGRWLGPGPAGVFHRRSLAAPRRAAPAGPSDTCAVFVGDEGLGRYHGVEARTAFSQQLETKHDFRLIPVLLPGKKKPADGKLPPFLRQLTWVEFTGDPDVDDHGWARLIHGITGKRPVGPGPEPPSPARPSRRLLARLGRVLPGRVPGKEGARRPLLVPGLPCRSGSRYRWPCPTPDKK